MNEVVKRTLSGILYIALLVSAILFSKDTFLILFGFFYIVAVFEFCRLYQINKITGYAISVIFALSLFFINNNNNTLNSTYLIVLPFSCYLIIDLFQNQFSKENSTIKKYLHLIGYVVIPFLIITQLPYLNEAYTPLLILSIFIIIWCNDIFAYICGKLLGKHKLYEKISPKNTIECFIVVVVFTQIAAFVIFKFTNTQASLLFWILIGLAISVLGTVGDLVESKYK